MNNSTVIRALSSTFFCVYSVDLITHEYEEVYSEDYIQSFIPARGKTFESLLGWIRIRTYEQFLTAFDAIDDSEKIAASLQNTNSLTIECKTKVIGWIKVIIMVAERDEEGKAISLLVAGQNIDTEKQEEIETQERIREAYEEANRANAAKASFFSRMSHDIRTPLSSIMGMITIAKKHSDNKEKVDYCIDKINEASKKVLGLMNEILDVSRLETGKIELVKDEFSIKTMAESIFDNIRNLAIAKDQNLKLDISGISHREVCGDKTRIEEIINTLLSNSIKYTQEGGKIRLKISEMPFGDDHSTFIISIRDNSVGMTPEGLSHLFDPFARKELTGLDWEEDSGVRLAVVKKYIDAMNGSIEFTTEDEKTGEGMEVTIMLKLEIVAGSEAGEGAQGKETDEVPITALDLSGKTALLVEDDLLNSEIEAEIIGMTGITIEKAYDGAEALRLFETSPFHHYDIIFMDIQMPIMNGYDTSFAIRALDRPDSVSVPIIAMTANAFASDIRTALEAGMNEHIAKPINNALLAKVMKKFIG